MRSAWGKCTSWDCSSMQQYHPTPTGFTKYSYCTQWCTDRRQGREFALLLLSLFLKERLEQNERFALLNFFEHKSDSLFITKRLALFNSGLSFFLKRKLNLKMNITLFGLAFIKPKESESLFLKEQIAFL